MHDRRRAQDRCADAPALRGLHRGYPMKRNSNLQRSTGLTRTTTTRRRPISPASEVQRELVRAFGHCANCGLTPDDWNPLDPAHIIDRSLLGVGQDDPRAVIPLGRRCCHVFYDEGDLDLLPVLESDQWREHLAFAVERYGLLRTLERVTNTKWRPA